MDVETRLRKTDLPQVAVNTDLALSATTRRGRGRRRRRRSVLGAGAVLIVIGAGATAIRLIDQDARTNVATGPPSDELPSPEPELGATAVWDVDPATLPSEDSSSFTAQVTRLGCSGGVTGMVLRPGVRLESERIVVDFTVEALEPGMYDCPGNDWVPYEVDLGEPIGTRTLVDGSCLEGADAATTSLCADDGGIRWEPPDANEGSTPDLPRGESLVRPVTEISELVHPNPECDEPPQRPDVGASQEEWEEWDAYVAASDVELEITQANAERTGWMPASSRRLVDNTRICGWFRHPAEVDHQNGRQPMYASPEGPLLGYGYGPHAFVLVEELENPEFDLEAEMIARFGCLVSIRQSTCD